LLRTAPHLVELLTADEEFWPLGLSILVTMKNIFVREGELPLVLPDDILEGIVLSTDIPTVLSMCQLLMDE
jgi:hypothetical protein